MRHWKMSDVLKGDVSVVGDNATERLPTEVHCERVEGEVGGKHLLRSQPTINR
jgi:hypothetical protein